MRPLYRARNAGSGNMQAVVHWHLLTELQAGQGAAHGLQAGLHCPMAIDEIVEIRLGGVTSKRGLLQ